MTNISEQVAFIAIRARQGNENDDQAVIFGLVSVDPLSEWTKYESDKAKYKELAKIFGLKEGGKWEFWIARQYSLTQLRNKHPFGNPKDNNGYILWDESFAGDPFVSEYPSISDPPKNSFIPYAEGGMLSADPGEIKELLGEDKIDHTEKNYRYFSKTHRIIFFDNAEENHEPFLNLPTANLDKPTELSRIAFVVHTINSQPLPFVQRCHIHAFVRLLANGQINSADTSGSYITASAAIIASRNSEKTSNQGLLVVKDVDGSSKTETIGFDMITLSVPLGEGKKELRETTINSKKGELHVFEDFLIRENLEKIFDSTDGLIRKHTSGAYGAPAFDALGLTLDRKSRLSHGFGFRKIIKNNRAKLLLRFETVHHLKMQPLPGCVAADSKSDPGHMRHTFFTQEQPKHSLGNWLGLLTVPDSLQWVVALTGFDQSSNKKNNIHLTPFGLVGTESSFSGDFVANWNDKVAQVILNSIRSIKSGLNLSTLPRISISESNQNISLNWALFGVLTDSDPGNRRVYQVPKDAKIQGRFLYYVPIPINSTLVLQKYNPNQPPEWPEIQCVYDAFKDHDGKPLMLRGKLQVPQRNLPTDDEPNLDLADDPLQLGAFDSRDAIPCFRFQIKPIPPKPGDKTINRVRLGEYDFEIPTTPPSTQYQFALCDVLFTLPDNIPLIEFISRLPANTAIQVAEALPQRDIGDIGDAARVLPLVTPQNDDRALIIPLTVDTPAPADTRFFVLKCYERSSELWSHTISLQLEAHLLFNASRTLAAPFPSVSREEPEAKPELLYISREPFQVAAAQVIDLFANAEAGGGSVVGVWTPEQDSGRWELKIPSQRVTLFMPPQALGESMEKSKNNGMGFDDKQCANFRYSPVAQLEVDPSNLDTVYCESILNLHRLLGRPSASRSGVGLYSAKFELLYGLGLELPPKNQALFEAPYRLAERAAFDGRPPPYLLGTQLGEAYARRWGQIRSALASRLAVYDLTNPFNVEQRRFTQADGVVLQLRPSADLKSPIPGFAAHEYPGLFKDNGLDGGVTWPFESANILRSFLKHPTSEAAWLDRVSLSALGGYGKQRGEFDGKMTVIETVTAMGRVHRYQLERIGRITCFWNRAKHVIVYERSVVPSEQFAKVQHHQHIGRPVLRKVEEFVELLEPIKRFDSGKSKQDTGFILGAAFRSIKIRVDGRWGRDLRQGGWEIPLWRNEFEDATAETDTTLYPKPHIDLLMQAPDRKEVCCEIAEPEKLRFYTQTQGGSDPSQWPPVCTVDYPDAPVPSFATVDDHPMPLTDGMLPPPRSELPGWNRFTLGLVQNGERIDLGAGLGIEQSPSAQLRNVCIARAVPSAPTPGNTLSSIAEKMAVGAQKADLLIDQFEALLINLDPNRIDTGAMPLQAELLRRIKEFKGFKDSEAQKQLFKKAIDDLNIKPSDANFGDPSQQVKDEVVGAIKAGTDRLCKIISDVDEDISFQIHETLEYLQQLDQQHNTNEIVAALDVMKGTIKNCFDEALIRFDAANAPTLGLIDGLLEFELKLHAIKRMAEEANNKIASLQTVESVINETEAIHAHALKKLIGHMQNLPFLQGINENLTNINNIIISERTIPLRKLGEVKAKINQGLLTLTAKLDDILSKNANIKFEKTKGLKANLNSEKQRMHNNIENQFAIIKNNIDNYIENSKKPETDKRQAAARFVSTTKASIKSLCDNLSIAIKDLLEKSLNDVITEICGFYPNDVNTYISSYSITLEKIVSKSECYTLLNNFESSLSQPSQNIQNSLQELREKWEEERKQLEGSLRTAESALENIRTCVNDFVDKANDTHQKASNTLRLIRAVGDPPATPGLDMNRAEVAFVFTVGEEAGIDMTPVVARINRAIDTVDAAKNAGVAINDTLQSFGVSLPMRKLAEEFTPDALKDFDLSRVFPDMGGLKLGGLFKDFKLPDLMPETGSDAAKISKAIKIKHHFDASTRSATLDAVLGLPLNKPAKIFELGPVRLDLIDGNFNAEANIKATASKKTTQTSKGSIGGTFELGVAGMKVIQFVDTKLEFDNQGHTKFNVNPKKIQLADALQFLVAVLQQVTSDSGFVIEPLKQDGQTVGLAAILDTQLPNLTAGAFGVSNLHLHTSFEIITRPEFEIGIGLALGSRTRPFVLIISFLAGGGYVLSRTRYLPSKEQLTQELVISASAGASAAFNFGVIEGSVALMVGIEVAFFWRMGGAQSVSIALYVLAYGGIVVLGILNVDLSMRLEIRYVDNGLSCSGTLTFTVKISCFYKQKVRERVEYQLVGGSSSGNNNYDEGYM